MLRLYLHSIPIIDEEERFQFSGISWISGIVNLQHRMFFCILDISLLFLEKCQVFPLFRNETSTMMTCLDEQLLKFY